MTERHPVRWLANRARSGISDLPANAAWLLGKVAGGANGVSTGSPFEGVREGGRSVRNAVADTLPFGKDSLELRIERARDALDTARQAEEDAVEQAQRAKADAEKADAVAEQGRRRHAQAKKDSAAGVADRVKDAQRRADAMVAEERADAEAAAAKDLERVAKEVEDDNAEAQEKADASRERAQADIDAAREQMVAARQLADDAASEARAAADEARRSADQLASQAEAQASDADARVAEADGVRRQVSHEAANVVREVERNDATNDLNEQTKGELVELASSLGIEGRTQMNKDELVKAIRSASKKSAQSRS